MLSKCLLIIVSDTNTLSVVEERISHEYRFDLRKGQLQISYDSTMEMGKVCATDTVSQRRIGGCGSMLARQCSYRSAYSLNILFIDPRDFYVHKTEGIRLAKRWISLRSAEWTKLLLCIQDSPTTTSARETPHNIRPIWDT